MDTKGTKETVRINVVAIFSGFTWMVRLFYFFEEKYTVSKFPHMTSLSTKKL